MDVTNSIAGTVHISGRVVQAGRLSTGPVLDEAAEAAIGAGLATEGDPVTLGRGEYAAVLALLDHLGASGSEAVRALAERLAGR
ncbi:hypothetical protein ABTX81_06995 [Kitasatospora sp. NPDC097605]|uniref:hypothetical protein n=1 Tax=Kitasatospora sp. NPDC097605 TaxID=3157226 RepID=UPI00332125FC